MKLSSSLTKHSEYLQTAADRLVSEGWEEEEEDVCSCLSNREEDDDTRSKWERISGLVEFE